MFKERYGKEDLTNLEDKLKQCFKQLGDIILYLKEKMTINPNSSEHLIGSLTQNFNTSENEENAAT